MYKKKCLLSKIDVSSEKVLANRFEINSYPTLMLFKYNSLNDFDRIIHEGAQNTNELLYWIMD